MEQFRHAGLKYEYCLIDDAVSRVIKNSGRYAPGLPELRRRRAMSDMLATAYGSAATMTSGAGVPGRRLRVRGGPRHGTAVIITSIWKAA